MNKAALLVGILFSLNVFAETTTFDLSGPHCGGCRKMIEKNICKDKKFEGALAKCEVTVDEKTETGKVTLTNKPDQKIDLGEVEKAILATDSSYKITNKTTKK